MSLPMTMAHCRRTLWRRRAAQRAGFTVVELLVTIVIVGVVPSVLLPRIARRRHAVARIVVQDQLGKLSGYAQAYRELHRDDHYPSTAELAEFASSNFSGEFPGSAFVWQEDDPEKIYDAVLDYAYAVDRVFWWFPDERDGFIICARPEAPYGSGATVLCINENHEIADESVDAEAAAQEAARAKLAALRALVGVGRMLAAAPDGSLASQVLPYLETIDPQLASAQAFDLNQDQMIRLEELRVFAAPRPGEAPNVAEVRSVLFDTLAIYGLDGEVLPIAVPVGDLQGDLAALFTAKNISILIESSFGNAGVAKSQRAKVFAAESARRRGRWPATAALVHALQNEVSAQVGKTIRRPDAELLNAVYQVLAPPRSRERR